MWGVIASSFLSAQGSSDGKGGIPLGSFSDGETPLGQLNDFWGSFTGTPAEFFLQAGKKWVAEAKQKFDATVNTIPEIAFNDLSKKLNFGVLKFDLALRNSSQTKTKVGNRASMNDVKKAVSNIANLESQHNYNYNKSPLTESYTDRKHKGTYTFYKYKLTKKTISFFGNFTSNGVPNSDTLSKSNTPKMIGYGILAVVLFKMFSNNNYRKIGRNKGFFKFLN